MLDNMTVDLHFFLLCLGWVVGIFSGLLGVGGGVLSVPALMFIPPLLGLPGYSIHLATGISVFQALFGGTSSLWMHYKRGVVQLNLVLPLCLGSLVGGFFGGWFSASVSQTTLCVVFVSVLAITLLLSFLNPPMPPEDTVSESGASFVTMLPQIPFFWGFPVGFGISFISSNVGVGGAILLIPLLTTLKKVPLRWAIGSGAALVLTTALSATIGKGLAGIVPFNDAIWVTVGAFIGGWIGAQWSHRLSQKLLSTIMTTVIVVTIIRMLMDLLGKTT